MVEEADDEKPKKKPHTPGRDHRRKSAPRKRERFQKKAERKHKAKKEALQKQLDICDAMSPEARKLRPELEPKKPRPTDED